SSALGTQASRTFAFGRPLTATVVGSAASGAASPADSVGRTYGLLTDIRRLVGELVNQRSDLPTASAASPGAAQTDTRASAVELRTRHITNTAVTGVNSSQIVAATFSRLPPHAVVAVQGAVTRAA